MANRTIHAVALDLDSLHPVDLDLSVLLSISTPADVSLRWHNFGVTAPHETAARLATAQVVITNKVVLDAQVLAQAPELKCVLIAATGTNNVDLQACFERGIAVCHVRDYGANAVAQHTMALLLALAGSLPQYQGAVRRGQWAQSPHFCMFDFPVVELTGKTLGIVGYGAIGQAVARMARGFGMQVLASESLHVSQGGVQEGGGDAFLRRDSASAKDCADMPTRVPLKALLSQSDVVSLHCPLTEYTHHLIDAQALSLMKSSAFLLNTGRGPLVEPEALIAALSSGRLAGAGLDVLTQEPPDPLDPLVTAGLPNLIITPHMAWTSTQARQNIIDQVAGSLGDWLHDRVPARRLNPEC